MAGVIPYHEIPLHMLHLALINQDVTAHRLSPVISLFPWFCVIHLFSAVLLSIPLCVCGCVCVCHFITPFLMNQYVPDSFPSLHVVVPHLMKHSKLSETGKNIFCSHVAVATSAATLFAFVAQLGTSPTVVDEPVAHLSHTDARCL